MMVKSRVVVVGKGCNSKFRDKEWTRLFLTRKQVIKDSKKQKYICCVLFPNTSIHSNWEIIQLWLASLKGGGLYQPPQHSTEI